MVIVTDLINGAFKKGEKALKGGKAPYSAVIEYTLPADSTQQYFAMTNIQSPPETAMSIVVEQTKYVLLENYKGQYFPTNAEDTPAQINFTGKHLVFFERPINDEQDNVMPRAIIFQDGRLFLNAKFRRDRNFLTTFAPDLAEMNWVFKEREYWELFGRNANITTTIGPGQS